MNDKKRAALEKRFRAAMRKAFEPREGQPVIAAVFGVMRCDGGEHGMNVSQFGDVELCLMMANEVTRQCMNHLSPEERATDGSDDEPKGFVGHA